MPSGNPQWMLSEKETVLTSFSEDMKLVDCKKEENENGPFNEGKEENRQSQDGERLLYYLALGEFLMFLGTLLSGTGQQEVSGADGVCDPLYAGYGRSKKASFLL